MALPCVQVYVRGELLGGCDIVLEMQARVAGRSCDACWVHSCLGGSRAAAMQRWLGKPIRCARVADCMSDCMSIITTIGQCRQTRS